MGDGFLFVSRHLLAARALFNACSYVVSHAFPYFAYLLQVSHGAIESTVPNSRVVDMHLVCIYFRCKRFASQDCCHDVFRHFVFT